MIKIFIQWHKIVAAFLDTDSPHTASDSLYKCGFNSFAHMRRSCNTESVIL